jgi:valyl-tRNA synthetase
MRIALAPKRIEGNRHFLNKIWNASRLVLDLTYGKQAMPAKAPDAKADFNRWILSRLSHAAQISRDGLESFRIDESSNELYRFFWSDFCDWYLEIIKHIKDGTLLGSYREETGATVVFVLGSSLRLLHPFIPFITEELWQRLHGYPEELRSIALERYPEATRRDEAVERNVETFQSVVTAARTIRSEHGVERVASVPLVLRGTSEALAFIEQQQRSLSELVRTQNAPRFERPGGPRPSGHAMNVVPTDHGPIEVLVGLKGLVYPAHERARIERELKKIDKDLAAIDKKLSSPNFTDKAPKDVVEEARAQKKSLEEAHAQLLEARSLADEL